MSPLWWRWLVTATVTTKLVIISRPAAYDNWTARECGENRSEGWNLSVKRIVLLCNPGLEPLSLSTADTVVSLESVPC